MSGKRCSMCGVVKGVEAFSRNRSMRDGLDHRCKTCVRRYREENREEIAESQRRYREENREALLARYRRHREENREEIAESQRRYREENREALLELNRRYYKENREAERERNRRYRERSNNMTREAATRNREPYTPAEDAHILASDEPSAVIAVELGRTMYGIKNRRHYLCKAASA